MAIGPLVLVAALVAVVVARRSGKPAWREVLLVSWLLVPTFAFTLWPVKGYQYLLAGAPAVAVVAARGLMSITWAPPDRLRRRLPGALTKTAGINAVIAALVLASLVIVTLPKISGAPSAAGLAGTGGTPGGREVGRWIGSATPDGATVLTLGPSMANIIAYYGHRKAYGLSVSANPLHRNPSYTPVANPDHALRHGEMQFIVWDAWSAGRSPHFSQRLLTLARRFHGRVVHTEYVGSGSSRRRAIVVYAVLS
jgi:4-amino-4-deoxy-L-arabinose transferase-like glycosyltransferase